MADEPAADEPGVVGSYGYHTVRWKDGLEVIRVMQHQRQIVLYLRWQGRQTTVRLGPRVAELQKTESYG